MLEEDPTTLEVDTTAVEETGLELEITADAEQIWRNTIVLYPVLVGA